MVTFGLHRWGQGPEFQPSLGLAPSQFQLLGDVETSGERGHSQPVGPHFGTQVGLSLPDQSC